MEAKVFSTNLCHDITCFLTSSCPQRLAGPKVKTYGPFHCARPEDSYSRSYDL